LNSGEIQVDLVAIDLDAVADAQVRTVARLDDAIRPSLSSSDCETLVPLAAQGETYPWFTIFAVTSGK
jgi:hypothetical protein